MDFQESSEHTQLRELVRGLCAPFDDNYWLVCDNEHRFPQEFFEVFAASGLLGLCIPEEYGGSGAGVTEASIVMEEVAASGGALSACTTIHIALFGLLPIIKHGSDEQKRRFLPDAAKGELSIAFGVTEPDAGSDTTRISTFAKKVEGGYLVNGRKAWISRAAQADRILLVCRTTPRDEAAKPTDGITILFAKMDPDHIQITPIDKLGRNAVASNWLFIDDLFVADEDRLGDEGNGFKYLLDGLNPERILVAAECLGIGRISLARATEYAKERHVFDRAIGQNQGVQFPLAESLIELDAAELLVRKASWKYDAGLPCGREANSAKFAASNAGFRAADRALQVHGGFGYAKEYHIERYWREVRLLRITPVSNELVLAYVGNHVLGLPRSY
ncbi:MAG: Acyl-CoA dehydrogenase fadE12 [Microbacteriaceae bacterium]|nr:Acyl-CoA dehydrogenase fadE12 [Microbacteriaceae bacterium]